MKSNWRIFGNISEITLSDGNWTMKTPAVRPEIVLDEFIVMPNHMHAIVTITECDCGFVGATRRVAPTGTDQFISRRSNDFPNRQLDRFPQSSALTNPPSHIASTTSATPPAQQSGNEIIGTILLVTRRIYRKSVNISAIIPPIGKRISKTADAKLAPGDYYKNQCSAN
jgi:hypothetical protein